MCHVCANDRKGVWIAEALGEVDLDRLQRDVRWSSDAEALLLVRPRYELAILVLLNVDVRVLDCLVGVDLVVHSVDEEALAGRVDGDAVLRIVLKLGSSVLLVG